MRNVVKLPAKWCGYRNRSPELESLLSDYNDMLQRRDFSCNGGEHESVCTGTENGFIDAYGIQKYTCHECLENICNDPACEIRVNQCVRVKRSVGAFMSVIMYVFLRD